LNGVSVLSTYRVQLNKNFGFREMIEHLDYFSELGVTHLYLSPILRARPGSTHCYDVFDFSVINEELGGEEWFRRLAQEAKQRGLGLIVDIVPNHMALENPYMLDVLEKGRSSEYADFFDIDWNRSDRVLLPVLEERDLKQALEYMKIETIGGRVLLDYKGLKLPLSVKADEASRLQAEPGGSRTYIGELLDKQFYTLIYWKDSAQRINYRRFFEVNGLIAIREEEPRVFLDVHKKIFELVEAGLVSGVRVDHPDGLMNPEEYFHRLREKVGDIYVVAEKILAGDEKLRKWEIDGTTGYDFLRDVNSLLVDSDGEEPLKRVYQAVVGAVNVETEIVKAKRDVLKQLFQGDVSRICGYFGDASNHTREAVELLLESMPVYRTYFSNRRPPDEEDLKILGKLVHCSAVGEVLKFVHSEAMHRLQQLEPAVMAKGFEDTFFYRYNLLISLNEVGGDPTGFGLNCGEFHVRNLGREIFWPRTMLTTGTHDTKLSEDVRARINVLSEVPDEWGQRVNEWMKLNRSLKSAGFPDKNDEYRFYQVLLGTWNGYSKEYEERLVGYMLKAVKEAKTHTSWLNANEQYEQATSSFVRAALGNEEFMNSFISFSKGIATQGALNSLTQTVIKLTAPGVPDIYQGNETMSFSMVDPDNRRPVHFIELRKNLESVREARPENLLANLLDGKLKHYIVWKLLNLRKLKPQAFTAYTPLLPSGTKSKHLCAYSRTGLTVVVSRLTAKLPYPPIGRVWAETKIKLKGTHLDVLTGDRKVFNGETDVSSVLDKIPVAVLMKEDRP
jgi:(1->4)-alpha-D-glucan 1-alpha-D-glucosylmutase